MSGEPYWSEPSYHRLVEEIIILQDALEKIKERTAPGSDGFASNGQEFIYKTAQNALEKLK
jgi:hypothetical protein